MSKKTLLNETTVRRFMKLADMGSVRETKIQEFGGDYARDEEDHLKDELGATEHELGDEDHLADEEEDELAGDEGPVDMDVDMEEAPPTLEPEMASAVEDVIAAAVEELVAGLGPLGVQISVEGGDEEAPVDDVVDDIGLDVEEPLEGGGELDVGMAAVPDEGEPVPEIPLQEDTEALVNEVARRVALRLSRQNQKTQMVDELTERIFNRLTQK